MRVSEKVILVVTSVEAERQAILQGLKGDRRFDVVLGGVGSIAAGINTALALAEKEYRLVISAGIAGGFPNRAEVSSVVVASEIIVADLGVETLEGFATIESLGFGPNKVNTELTQGAKLIEALGNSGIPLHKGPILTVSTVTGTQDSANELLRRVPNAVAEAMEGFGVAYAAQTKGIPVIEVRAISNLVGPRDRAAWKIKEALEALTVASSKFSEVFFQ